MDTPQHCGMDMVPWHPTRAITVWQCAHRIHHPMVCDYPTPVGTFRAYESVSDNQTEGCAHCGNLTRSRCQRCDAPLCAQCTGSLHDEG